MKKFLAYLILVSHMNFIMFIPQLEETDEYDSMGTQIDDINSLYEYIDEVVLEHKDPTPEDEDDDSPREYHVIKMTEYSCTNNIPCSELDTFSRCQKSIYPLFKTQEAPAVFFEIQSPPPRIA